jgi:hypothetical protein
MVSINTKIKIKNIAVLTLVSTTFILSVISYATQQQVFAQGVFQTQQPEINQSSSSSPITGEVVISEQEEEEGNETKVANQSTITEKDRKIILGDITLPINYNTTLSLEMPDSQITVEPIK